MLEYLNKLAAAEPVFLGLAACFYVMLLIFMLSPALRSHLERPKITSHLAELDGLRGYLAILVLGVHYADTYGPSTWIKTFFGPMPIAVPTFAVLSGFVLYRSFRVIDADTLRAFLIRRVLRIYPAYVLCFLLTIIGIIQVESLKYVAVNWLRLASDLLMLDLLQYGWRIDSATWSLYPEMAYSFTLPLFVLVFGLRSLPLNIALYICFVLYSGSSGMYISMFRFFWMGMIILQIYESRRLAKFKERTPYAVGEALFTTSFFAGLVYIALQFDLPGDIAAAIGGEKIYGWLGLQKSVNLDIGCALTFIGILYSDSVKWIFRTAALQYLGIISYSVYLLHFPLAFIASPDRFVITSGAYYDNLHYFDDLGASFVFMYVPAVLFVATVSFICVERIGMKWGKTLSIRALREETPAGRPPGRDTAR